MNATAAYSVHVEFLTAIKALRRFLIDHGHSLVSVLPAPDSSHSGDGGISKRACADNQVLFSDVVMLAYDLSTTAQRNVLNVKLHVLHTAMQNKLSLLDNSTLR